MESVKIKLIVKNDAGEIVNFKVKTTTKLSKLMDAYCTRAGLSIKQCRFIFDGKILQPYDTPDKLNMEDDDQIDVNLEQVGGSFWQVINMETNMCNWQQIIYLFVLSS